MAAVVQMRDGAGRHYAVVGAGPSGLYAVERFLKGDGVARVDVFDRDPTPFGLVRYGVAPDHQSTKGISRIFDRALSDPRVQFFGGVEIGRDLTLAELSSAYDAVLLATGAECDKALGIPGEDLRNVVASGKLVSWLNRRLSAAEPPADLSDVREVVLVGLGNVAIDIARLLLKRGEDFAGSDLCPDVEAALAAAPVRTVTIVGRGSIDAARFGQLELQEILALDGIGVEAMPPVDPSSESMPAKLIGPAVRPSRDGRNLVFRFGAAPAAIEGAERVERIQLAVAGGRVEIPADLVVTCIGSRAAGIDGVACNLVAIENDDGLVAPGLYVTGWAGQGAQGTIPTARAGAHRVVSRILDETRPNAASFGNIIDLLRQRNIYFFDRAAWLAIDDEERARARPNRVRQKIADLETMRNVAGKSAENDNQK